MSRSQVEKYTPLTRKTEEILQTMEKWTDLRRPRTYSRTPQKEKSSRFCRFHNEYGHTTDSCIHLKDEIERLVQAGHLKVFVYRERKRGRDDSRRRHRSPSPRKSRTDDSKKRNHPTPKGTIHMIVGGPSDGDSHPARKSYVRLAAPGKRTEIVYQVTKGPVISFGPEDEEGVLFPHSDVLVIKAMIANYDVERIFIDGGSSVDILFWDCFRRMDLADKLEKVETSLMGFAGGSIQPLGAITLPMTLGE